MISKRLAWALAVLYALSLAAAVFLVARSGGASASRPEGLLKAPVKFLPGSRKDGVAVVSVSGPIYQDEGSRVLGRGFAATARRLHKLAERKEVKAVLLEINSPGGSVGAVQELHALISRLRGAGKPVVASLGDVAASGGYYLAAGCDKIVAHPGTLLGSIGVIFHYRNAEGLLAKIGLRSEAIKSGKMKDIGSMSRPMSPEEKALLQSLIDDAYGQFLGAVSEGRKIPAEELRALADGRVFTGAQARKLGLVDELGDSRAALELAAKLGGIAGKPEVYREGESLGEMLLLLESMAPLGPRAFWRDLEGRLGPGGLEYRWRM